jgi:hypothetical protein
MIKLPIQSLLQSMTPQPHTISQPLVNILISGESKLNRESNLPPELSISSLKHHVQKKTAERTLYSLHTITYYMLLDAKLPPKFAYHTIRYSIEVLYLSYLLRSSLTKEANLPDHMSSSIKGPMVRHFRLCGGPYITKKYIITHPKHKVTSNNTSQKGVMGIFIGFPTNKHA